MIDIKFKITLLGKIEMELAREAAIKAYEEKQIENKQMANILKDEV